MLKKLSLISMICVIIDQVIKLLVTSNINLYDNIEIIKNFFYITNVRNTGAAFSILSGNVIFLILISLIMLVLVISYLKKNKNNLSKSSIILFDILIGGIIGNMIDRVIYGYVIDYLEIHIFNYQFPVFNFADICITMSIILIIIKSIKEDLCNR